MSDIQAQIEAENEAMTDIPTLDQLLARLALAPEVVQLYFRLVASGKYPPILEDSNAVLAAQAMSILFNHIKTNR